MSALTDEEEFWEFEEEEESQLATQQSLVNLDRAYETAKKTIHAHGHVYNDKMRCVDCKYTIPSNLLNRFTILRYEEIKEENQH